ncbi:MAG: hypothetical protein WCO26_11215 [Deltaproteobacteria bacterium]
MQKRKATFSIHINLYDFEGQINRVEAYFTFTLATASFTLGGVIGSWWSLAPVASNTALAMTAPMQTMGGSPPPWGGMSGASIR